MYIIIYNAENDFFKVYGKEEAEVQIASLIKEGLASDEIELYDTKDVEYKVTEVDIKVSIK